MRPLRGSLYVKCARVRARDASAAQRAGYLEANDTPIANVCASLGNLLRFAPWIRTRFGSS